MSSHFSVSWFWNNDNLRSVLSIYPSLCSPVFHICSGGSNLGDVRLDITYINAKFHDTAKRFKDKYVGSPTVLGDMNRLPFKSGVAGSVICDPPYDYDFTKDALISELIRICKPGGKIVFIAPWVPCSAITTVLDTQIWKVGKNRPYHKIMSILVKSNGQIEDYL